MAIEGPLRELGIHDVFQLLDLSRKTGTLRVASELREDEGVVSFDSGRVIRAAIRSKAVPAEILLLQSGRVSESDLATARARRDSGASSVDLARGLVEIGAITQKEMERQLRLQIESVVFELMSWSEGFFSFEERPRDSFGGDMRVSVSTESLLMEGARRIDEWSRIADVVPNLTVVPDLAPVNVDREGAMLDLLPHEWQVLTMIDGRRDLRGIAAALARDEFEIAKIAYGLTTTGIIILQPPQQAQDVEAEYTTNDLPPAMARSLAEEMAIPRSALEQFLRMSPSGPAAAEAREVLDALTRLQRVLKAHSNG
jgi:hypothetical protein